MLVGSIVGCSGDLTEPGVEAPPDTPSPPGGPPASITFRPQRDYPHSRVQDDGRWLLLFSQQDEDLPIRPDTIRVVADVKDQSGNVIPEAMVEWRSLGAYLFLEVSRRLHATALSISTRAPSTTTSRHWVIHTPDSLEITVDDSGETSGGDRR